MLRKNARRPSLILSHILYNARIFRVIDFILVAWTVTNKRKVLLSLFGSNKIVAYSFFQVCVIVNMSPNHKNFKKTSYNNKINIDKALERFLRLKEINKNNEDDSSDHASVEGSYGEPSIHAKHLLLG